MAGLGRLVRRRGRSGRRAGAARAGALGTEIGGGAHPGAAVAAAAAGAGDLKREVSGGGRDMRLLARRPAYTGNNDINDIIYFLYYYLNMNVRKLKNI